MHYLIGSCMIVLSGLSFLIYENKKHQKFNK